MRVQRLYIFCLTSGDAQDDAEVIGGCKSLFERSKSKCDVVSLVTQDEKINSPEKVGKVGVVPKRDVGAYLVCHAYGGEPTWGRNNIGELIILMIKMMGGEDFRNLKKLAVLACGGATPLKKAKIKKLNLKIAGNVDNADNGLERKELLRLLLLLKEQHCRPMVAGYDCFISVAYPETKFDEIKAMKLEPGQKVIDDGKGGYRRAGKSKKHKRFFRLDKQGAVETMQHALWSDK